MSNDLIADLTEQRAIIADAMEQMAAAEDFDPKNPEWLDMKTRGEGIDTRITGLRESAQHREAAERLRDQLVRAPAAKGEATTDVGDLLIRSEAWRTWKRNGSTGRAHLATLDMNRRAITSTWLPGTADTVMGQLPTLRTPVLDLLRNVQVDSLTVPIISLADSAPFAGVVAEGSQKPEATITPTDWTVSLQTIAHWVEVSRQALADNALVRDIVSGSLMRGVNAKAEAEAAGVINGGTYGTATGATMLEAIRIALAKVQTNGYQPNGILIHPDDAAALDNAIWTTAGLFPTVNSTLFGLRLVASPSVGPGTAFVGDFQAGAYWFYRGSAELYVSDSDVGMVASAAVSNFKRNYLTFLAEIMAKAAVVQGAAIIKATAGAAMSAGAGRGVNVGSSKK